MLLIHESNFKNKINSNYKGLGEIIEDFYLNEYLKTKTELLEIDFSKADTETFKRATNIINEYYKKLDKFTVLNVAPVISEAIKRINSDRPISTMILE